MAWLSFEQDHVNPTCRTEKCSPQQLQTFLLPVSEDEKVLLTGAPWEWRASTVKSFSVTFTLTGVFTGESEDQVFWLFELVKTLFIKLIRINSTRYACSNPS